MQLSLSKCFIVTPMTVRMQSHHITYLQLLSEIHSTYHSEEVIFSDARWSVSGTSCSNTQVTQIIQQRSEIIQSEALQWHQDNDDCRPWARQSRAINIWRDRLFFTLYTPLTGISTQVLKAVILLTCNWIHFLQSSHCIGMWSYPQCLYRWLGHDRAL